jgi:hypothetical protein
LPIAKLPIFRHRDLAGLKIGNRHLAIGNL